MLKLRTLLGDYPHTMPLKDGRIKSSVLELDVADISAAHTAFKPFVRDLAFDCGELAIVTYLQAKAYNKPLILLPIVVSSRFHHGSIFYNSERGVVTPQDLVGKSVAVRTYAQTTGVWVRGIFRQDYGVDSNQVEWVTFDESHLAEYSDPPNCRRAAPGKDLIDMLADGEVAAAIPASLAPSALNEPPFKPVVADAPAVAMDWYRRHQIVPINHLFVIRRSVVEDTPEVVPELLRMFAESKKAAGLPVAGEIDMLPLGIEALRGSLEAVIQFAFDQKLIPRRFAVEELFEGLPELSA